MKKKVSFQSLIDGKYQLGIELEVLNWILKTGRRYDECVGKWNRRGIDQLCFSYSHNNNTDSFTEIGNNLEINTRLCFINLIVQTVYYDFQKRWRKENNIYLNKYRMLYFDNDVYSVSISNIRDIYKLNNSKLKKEFFHPEFPNDINPFITNIEFSTNGNGYRVLLGYTFENCKNSGWEKEFSQEDLTLKQFLTKTLNEIKQLII